MKYDFDTPVNRYNTASIKFDKTNVLFPEYKKDFIPLFVADMDFRTAQPIIDTMHNVADFGMWGYTSNEAEPEYNKAVINWFKKHHDCEIKPEEIMFSNGTIEALRTIINTFSNIGDGVIICRPVYGHFNQCIEDECYRKVVDAHLILNEEKHTWEMNFDEIEKKCANPQNRIMIISNPHNPVGRVWSKEELSKVAEICHKYNVLLVSDEVHCDIVRKGQKHNTIYNSTDLRENIIMLTAINKTFNMAGLSCSNVIIKDKFLRERFICAFGEHNPSPFAVYGLIAAYNDGDEWLSQAIEYIDGNINWLISFLKDNMPKVKTIYPEGTYCLWLDFSDYGLSGDEIHNIIYNKAKVLLQDGFVHDPVYGEYCQRVCVPCARCVLKEAFERIKTEFDKIN